MSHAIVEQMEPSDEQRPAIEWRGTDLLVTAGAGSGKTRTLVARYLDLLAEGLPLRSLVAVTFTRKAAREMRNRVRVQVQRYLGRSDLWGPAAPAGERERWLELYGALDAARIGTIHSLCGEFLRAHPAEAGVDPRFEVLDEAQTSLLRRQAVDEALAWAAAAPEARALYDLLDEGDLRAVAEQMLNQRLDIGPALASGVSPWPRWQALLCPPLAGFVDSAEVRAAFGELAALRGGNALVRAQAAGDELVPVLIDLCQAWDQLCAARVGDDWEQASRCFLPLDGLLKQKGKKGNWAPANPKELIGALQELYRAVPAWLRKGDLALDRRLAEAMPALSGLYASVMEAYARLRDERNALDFDDLEERALVLLRDNAAVLSRWREDVQAILVDEFQDTNRRQLELLELLNGKRGCAAFVGDDKQSIYGFRGAEVSVFRALKRRCSEPDGVTAPPMAARSLQVSYRAHRELVAGLNALLRPALGEQSGEDLQANRREPDPGWSSPYIEFHLTVGTKGEGKALERAACALAARLRELASGGRMLREGDSQRPLGYGDMAILCRTTRSFAPYEDALDNAGIPFTTVAGRGFYQRPEIRDLLNALRALSEPSDDLAVAGLLRSPALGLSDATLYALCRQKAQGGAESWPTGLWQILQGPLPGVASPERDRAQRAATLIAELHQGVGRIPVADLLKAFVDSTHYRAALRQAGQGRAVRNVDKLLADAHASGIVSVGEFVEYVTLLRDAGTREGEARATSEGAVQIMSVHAAKGLEFPIVVLGDISADKGSGGRILLDPELGVLLPLRKEAEAAVNGRRPQGNRRPATYLYVQEREEKEGREESARLLYVAATRVREMLLVSGCMKLDKDHRPSALGEWLGWLAAPLGLCKRPIAYEETGCGTVRMKLKAEDTPVGCDIYEPGCSWEQSSVPEPEMDVARATDPHLWMPLIPSEDAKGKREDQGDLGLRVWQVTPLNKTFHAPSWVVGQLVHEALSAWRFPDVGFEEWAEARAQSLGLIDLRMLHNAAARSAVLLRRFRAHPLYEEMNGAAERLAEVPYSRRGEDGCTDNGVIDALIRHKGQWTIVEFKTDHVKDPADARRIMDDKKYGQQADRYKRAVQDLLGDKPRHVHCWLDYAGKVVCEPTVAE